MSIRTPLDYERPKRKRTLIRFYGVTALGAFAGFIAWCARDYLYVRVPTWHNHNGEGWFFLFPILMTLAGYMSQAGRPRAERLGLGIAAALLASFLVAVLILFVGMQFHFAIGGQL